MAIWLDRVDKSDKVEDDDRGIDLEEDVVEDNGDKQQCLRQVLESYVFYQSHRPRRGELVSYYDVDFEDWMSQNYQLAEAVIQT